MSRDKLTPYKHRMIRSFIHSVLGEGCTVSVQIRNRIIQRYMTNEALIMKLIPEDANIMFYVLKPDATDFVNNIIGTCYFRNGVCGYTMAYNKHHADAAIDEAVRVINAQLHMNPDLTVKTTITEDVNYYVAARTSINIDLRVNYTFNELLERSNTFLPMVEIKEPWYNKLLRRMSWD